MTRVEGRALVSVALCTFNGVAYVAEQLLSILDQTQTPTQMVVSDDASTDGTVELVESVVADWHEHNPERNVEVHVIRNESALGVTANFEQALAACSGDILALSDQDDVWHPRRLERMTAEFVRRPGLLLLHTDARLVDGDGHPLGMTLLETLGVTDASKELEHAGRALDILLRRNIVTGATVLVRRELVDRARPFPADWVHDEWLSVIAALVGTMDLLDEELVDYRQHGGNQIGVTSLDTAGRLARLRAPRTERNRRLLARAVVLAERAPLLSPAPDSDALNLLDEKVAHERARSDLPAARAARLLPVLREWRTGRYSRFGRGAQDVLRDLVQPV